VRSLPDQELQGARYGLFEALFSVAVHSRGQCTAAQCIQDVSDVRSLYRRIIDCTAEE
jgi:hypothetical protein